MSKAAFVSGVTAINIFAIANCADAAPANPSATVPDFAADSSTYENNANYLEQYRFPMPTAEKPDF